MKQRTVEIYFFFALLIGALVLTFFMFMPFISMLAITAVVASLFYPLYEKIRSVIPRKSSTVASLITLLLVIALVVTPLAIISFFLFQEAADVYTTLNGRQGALLDGPLAFVEEEINYYIPQASIDFEPYVKQAAGWLTQGLQTAFAQTAFTILMLFIGLIALYYFFKDGEDFKREIVLFSPLDDNYDDEIIERLRVTIHSVILGSVTIALLQGTLTAIGFTLFGISNGVLWGALAAIGALIPGVGTVIVFLPAIIYLFFVGSYGAAIGLLVWGAVAVGLIDNLLGPRLIGKGAQLHPFLILLAVLGGLSMFGPVGFFIGPLILAFVAALRHIYTEYVVAEGSSAKRKPRRSTKRA